MAQQSKEANNLECDLVMRGGITSGIVYPKAIAELARKFRFRSIGGTSAGAIAAVATAAAAYGKQTGKNTNAFDLIEAVPDDLARKENGETQTRMIRLFQPENGSAPLFNAIMEYMSAGKNKFDLPFLAARCFPLDFFLGALPALALTYTLLRELVPTDDNGPVPTIAAIISAVAAVLALLAGPLAMVAWRIYRIFKNTLPKAGFGMCTGMPTGKQSADDPLTVWLHKLIQESAGLNTEKPLTVGMLAKAGRPNSDQSWHDDPAIQLVLMTTNITSGVSGSFPALEGWRNNHFFFRSDELKRYFPGAIIRHLIHNPPKRSRAYDIQEVPEGYHPLPDPENLPVLLGARMSMSFPLLLSAIPLYRIDWRATNSLEKPRKLQLQKCWFSDGGITSNFPVHFFDSALPSRPTFCINLVADTTEVHEVRTGDRAQQSDGQGSDNQADKAATQVGIGVSETLQQAFRKVSMPETNQSPSIRTNEQADKSTMSFLFAMLDTARNWQDNELITMPGYRDRIVNVHLGKDEGGMNLNMTEATIRKIADRGMAAGMMLTSRFLPRTEKNKPNIDAKTGQTVSLDWDNHRWVRYRSTMAALESLSLKFEQNWGKSRLPGSQEDDYEGLLERDVRDAPSYPWANKTHKDHAVEVTSDYLKKVASWNKGNQSFKQDPKGNGKSPAPQQVLRMMPPE